MLAIALTMLVFGAVGLLKPQSAAVKEDTSVSILEISLADLPIAKAKVEKSESVKSSPSKKRTEKPKPKSKPIKVKPVKIQQPKVVEPVVPPKAEPVSIVEAQQQALQVTEKYIVFTQATEQPVNTEAVTENVDTASAASSGVNSEVIGEASNTAVSKQAAEVARQSYYPKIGRYLQTFVMKEYRKAEAKGHSAFGETIKIQYTIDREGNILDYKVIKKPKSNQVSRAIRKGIKAAEPFPPIPSAMSEQTLTRVLSINIQPPVPR